MLQLMVDCGRLSMPGQQRLANFDLTLAQKNIIHSNVTIQICATDVTMKFLKCTWQWQGICSTLTTGAAVAVDPAVFLLRYLVSM